MTEKEIREQLYTSIHGCNKYLTRDYLKDLSLQELLANAHPLDRADFKRKLESLNLI